MTEHIDSGNEGRVAIREVVGEFRGYGLPTYGVALSEEPERGAGANGLLKENYPLEGR